MEAAGIEIKQDNRGKYVYASYGYVIPLTDEEREFHSQFGIPLDQSCRVGFKFYLGGDGIVTGSEFSQEYGKWQLPSTYAYKNGEWITAPNGDKYELFNNKWVKLNGAQVDVNVYMHIGNSTGYTPSIYPFYIDQNILVQSGINQIKDGFDLTGMGIGILSEWKFPKINSMGFAIGFGLNVVVGGINNYNESLYHDTEVEKMRNPK
jgi:hypothetical protein